MNKKIFGSIAAIIAVLGLIGGGTFAAWSDFAEDTGDAGAGILQLTLSNSSGSGTHSFGFGNMAPGHRKIQEIYLASSADDSVPNASLSLTVENLIDVEANGDLGNPGVGNGCTTDSERAEEGGDCGSQGEFSEDAWIQIRTKPAPTTGSCGGGSYTTGVYQGPLSGITSLSDTVLDGLVLPGEGVCVRMELGLPDGTPDGTNGSIDFAGTTDSTNRSQGDQATFDITFDLVQVIS